MGTWSNEDAGPKVKRVNEAIGKLKWEGQTFTQITGVIGGEEHRYGITEVFGTVRPEVQELLEKLGETFDWTVTKANAKEIVSTAQAMVEEAKPSRREQDERRTPEEVAESAKRQNEQSEKWAAEAEAETLLRAKIRQKAPAGAKAVVMAELNEDKSDTMTDYFANATTRRVAIGFRFGAREDFRQLRRAAASFPETAHLDADDQEHRDNYSMGKGNYLGTGNWGSGWCVRSYPLESDWWHVTEDVIPELPEGHSTGTGPELQADGYEIRPSSIGREGVVEVHFANKPEEDVRAALKSAGFRWARANRCWYGREDRLEGVLNR